MAQRVAAPHNGSIGVFEPAGGTRDHDAPPTEHGSSASTTFVFEVPELAAAMTDLKSKGIRFLHATPAANEWGRYAAFLDPFGNVLELFERI